MKQDEGKEEMELKEKENEEGDKEEKRLTQ